MRARQRHFSYKAAGSGLTVDARYVTGVANGAAFSPWNDLSGNANNPSQANTSYRPTYVSNYSTFGGQPAVNFNNLSQLSATNVSARSIFLVMHRPLADYYNYGVSLQNTTRNAGIHGSASADYAYDEFVPSTGLKVLNITRVNRVNVTNSISGSYKWWTAGGVGYFEDTSGWPLGKFGFGGGGNYGPRAHIAHASLFAPQLTPSLVRKIEDHLGFSFKLAN